MKTARELMEERLIGDADDLDIKEPAKEAKKSEPPKKSASGSPPTRS